MVETIENLPKDKQNWRERERVLTSFVVDNLEGIEDSLHASKNKNRKATCYIRS